MEEKNEHFLNSAKENKNKENIPQTTFLHKPK